MTASYYEGNKTFRIGDSGPIAPGPGEVRLNVSTVLLVDGGWMGR